MEVDTSTSSSSSVEAGHVKKEPLQSASPSLQVGEDEEDARVRRQLELGLDGGQRPAYHPLAPVPLPLRPRSPEEAPLPFAACSQATDSEERQARRREEEEVRDIFLLQLPSTLLPPTTTGAETTPASAPASEDTEPFILRPMGAHANLVSSGAPPERDASYSLYKPNQITRLSAGCVGKLQIMKSGKVYLVVDGRPGEAPLRHLVSLGVRTTFAQSLVAVAPGEQGQGMEGASDDMFVLGDITKKLVITPEFAL